jgi:hypothetical protein
LFWGYSWEAKD